MVNAECIENIRRCGEALKSKSGTEVRIRAMKTFINYAEKKAEFGSEAALIWKANLENAGRTGLTAAGFESVKIKKDDVEKTADFFAGLKAFMDRSIDNGYNFEF